MSLKFLFKSCKTSGGGGGGLGGGGGGWGEGEGGREMVVVSSRQWVQKQRKIFSKGLKREARNYQQ